MYTYKYIILYILKLSLDLIKKKSCSHKFIHKYIIISSLTYLIVKYKLRLEFDSFTK